MPPRRSTRGTGPNINDNPNNNADGLAELLTQIVANLNAGRANNGEDKVEYAACLLQGRALTWWNTQVQTRRRDAANGLTWETFKGLLTEEYCRKDEMQKLESEFWNH
ncbi:reverse transcriptase domain-containing protein [Tanacetum coccineum]